MFANAAYALLREEYWLTQSAKRAINQLRCPTVATTQRLLHVVYKVAMNGLPEGYRAQKQKSPRFRGLR
jgi:hypothetical protein